ncbi:exonuclease domain-containing protein [Thioalkalivibrio sp. XN279]|uniref:exonuclease domain-containing protein n=1 Tax=Thioalkalivibrio sp. XN279 TaxID=2714953 RepID=UPI001409A73B|nr:exonuclease domain-containing protein [Thioalkalivibrio sp. XN279]NHA13894.1 DNA polymerase III subunit epsilon [Thioalkalivibrio sp. XN279]
MTPWQRLRLALAKRKCSYAPQACLLEHAPPAGRQRVAEVELVAMDFETTGLDPARDHIIAVGWVLLRGDRIVMASAREIRVRNEAADGVGQSAIIHGITDSDLDDADSVDGMLAHLLPELAGRAVVAHAASIERGFLNAVLRRLGGVPLPNPFIDTMTLERRLLEGKGGSVRELHGDLTLDACRERRQLPEHQRHSAGADAIACAELLLAQLDELGGARGTRLKELL